MKNIKIYIFITIIIIILIIISMLYIINKVWDEEEVRENWIDSEEELIVNIDIIDRQIKYVDNRNEYFAVKTCIQKYLQNIIVQNSEVLYNLLDKDFISKNNITVENVLENIDENGKYYDEIILEIDEMYTIKNENDLAVYFIYGKIAETYEEEFQDFYIMVRLDKTNDTFSILPRKYMQENNYLELKINDEVQANFESIEKNTDNEYMYENIDDEEMSKNYFYDYINKMKYETQKAYEMLNEEYKQKRFQTFEKFNEYAQNMDTIRIDTYSVKKVDNYTQYVCKDVYGREYIFIETAIMQYTAILDNYTIENSTIRQAYAKDSDKDRALYNIDKFFQMLNMQDYETAYSVLDDSFKQNYFQTQADFENYMKQNIFKYNKVTYKQYSNKISSLHIYNVEVSDLTGITDGSKPFTIIVKLLDDMNFKLSFEV